MTHDRSAQLLALAAKVEALTGPDREADAEIAALQHLRVVDEGHPLGRVCYDRDGLALLLPRYTASFDAAMTLVPEGQFLRFYSEGVQAIIVRPFSGSWLEVSRAFGLHGPAVVVASALRALAQGHGHE